MLSSLNQDRYIQIYVTPQCPYCPLAVLTANRVAIEKKGIVTSECVEAQENPDLAMKYSVISVPLQVINEKISSVGVQPEAKFVHDVLTG